MQERLKKRGADPVGHAPSVEELIVEHRQVRKHGIPSLVGLDGEVVAFIEPVVEPVARLKSGGELFRQRLVEAEAEPELHEQLAECTPVDVVQDEQVSEVGERKAGIECRFV